MFANISIQPDLICFTYWMFNTRLLDLFKHISQLKLNITIIILSFFVAFNLLTGNSQEKYNKIRN